MPWFKIDDGFHCHPKALAAGNAAIGLWSRLGSYSSDQLTDGFIPAGIAKAYGTRSEVQRLITVRLLEPGEHDAYGDGYWLHDFLDYNPTAETVKTTRDAAAARQRRWRESHAKSHDESRRDTTDSAGGSLEETRLLPDDLPTVTQPYFRETETTSQAGDNRITAGQTRRDGRYNAVSASSPTRPDPTRPKEEPLHPQDDVTRPPTPNGEGMRIVTQLAERFRA